MTPLGRDHHDFSEYSNAGSMVNPWPPWSRRPGSLTSCPPDHRGAAIRARWASSRKAGISSGMAHLHNFRVPDYSPGNLASPRGKHQETAAGTPVREAVGLSSRFRQSELSHQQCPARSGAQVPAPELVQVGYLPADFGQQDWRRVSRQERLTVSARQTAMPFRPLCPLRTKSSSCRQ